MGLSLIALLLFAALLIFVVSVVGVVMAGQRKKPSGSVTLPMPLPPGSTDGDGREAVPVYDAATRSVRYLPAAELAPGMVQVQLGDTKQVVWMEASQLQPNVHRHPPFDEARRERLRALKADLDEVYPQTLEFWEDGFRRDQNPDSEIAIWEHIARVYRKVIAGRNFSPAEKQDVYRTLVACSNSTPDQVRNVLALQTLSRDDAGEIIARYYAPSPDA